MKNRQCKKNARPAVILFSAGLAILVLAATATAEKKLLRIIHTNDIQSRMLGFGPNAEFTPYSLNDDQTVGGISRVATAIKKYKSEAPEKTLILDGGDMMMGSLFHTIAKEHAAELRLMHKIGYDAAVLGNHEFDFRPGGLVKILKAAEQHGGAPTLLLANPIFDPNDAGDDAFEELYQTGLVRQDTIIESNGMKIGLFGLMGTEAAEVAAPLAAPLKFGDPVESARTVAKSLRERGAELIIALSHGGVKPDEQGDEWSGDDRILAESVDEIDLIVSGHSHRLIPEPLIYNGAPVVQAGAEGQYVGVLDVEIENGALTVSNYQVITIDDSIPADVEIQAEIERYKQLVTENVLSEYGFAFDQVLAETEFDLLENRKESNLGDLVADALRWGVNHYDPDFSGDEKLDFAVEANGQIRDNILKGRTGRQQVADLFRVVGLGPGIMEDVPGYPLVKIYLTAEEIKKALEVSTTLAPLKSPIYTLQISGLRFRYNPNRMLFDRVVEVETENDDGSFTPLDLSSDNEKLYSVCATFYVASFIKIIGGFTYNILDIVPKDKHGNPLPDIKSAIIDRDRGKEGVQELKEWAVFLEYLQQLPDSDGDGVPNIPEKYRKPQGRMVAVDSWEPSLMVKNATWVTWTTGAVGLAFITGILLLAWLFFKRRFRAK